MLQLYRVGLWYSVWLFFDRGRFRNWYINFEAPVVGDKDGFDTDDYGLDLIVSPGQEPVWKDVDHLDAMIGNGRLDSTKVLGVLAARQVADLLRRDDRWWSSWDGWAPDGSKAQVVVNDCTMARLPPGHGPRRPAAHQVVDARELPGEGSSPCNHRAPEPVAKLARIGIPYGHEAGS